MAEKHMRDKTPATENNIPKLHSYTFEFKLKAVNQVRLGNSKQAVPIHNLHSLFRFHPRTITITHCRNAEIVAMVIRYMIMIAAFNIRMFNK